MRLFLLVLMLAGILLLPLPGAGQEITPTGGEPEPGDLDAAAALLASERAEAAVEEARRYAEDAANYLGIFESVGVAIGVLTGLVIPALAIVGGLFGLNRLREARAELTEARQRFESDLLMLREALTAELLAKQEELDRLKEDLQESAKDERVRSEQATLALSLLPLGERQYRVDDFDGALDTYSRALRLDPDNAVIHYRLGYVYTQLDKLDEATHHLMRALQLDPEFAPALANFGYVLRRRAEALPHNSVERGKLLAEAELKLREALAISPKLVDEDGESWWGSLGGLHRRRGQIDDAIDAYERAQKVTPQASYPVANLALLYMQKHDPDRMLSAFQRSERLAQRRVLADGGDFWAWADLLISQLAQGKYEEAEDTLAWVLSVAPGSAPHNLRAPVETLRQLAALSDERIARELRPFIERLSNAFDPQAAQAVR